MKEISFLNCTSNMKEENLMIEAISKNDLIGNDGKLDIYAFMRSKEIRDYMRINESFDLEDTIYIILKSMNPYRLKLEALKILGCDQSLSEQERRHVLYVTRCVERILQEIYSPESPAVIAMNECVSVDGEEMNEYEVSMKERNSIGYYVTYQDLLEQYSEYVPEEDEPLPLYKIDLFYQESKWRNYNPIRFAATWFDGKIEIFSIHVDSEWGEEHSFKSSITDYFCYGRMGQYSLPFPSMSKVKLQTPFMREPLVGILDSSLDGCGCWYHFFYPNDRRGLSGSFMDFSYYGIDICSDLMVFDWVSSDDVK